MGFLEARKQIEFLLIKKAKEDKKFERLLFMDPSAALRSLSIVVPDDMVLKVVKENNNEMILAYPLELESDELNELELLNVSGGSNISSQGLF